jgi:arylsulfatase A-like enzyme
MKRSIYSKVIFTPVFVLVLQVGIRRAAPLPYSPALSEIALAGLLFLAAAMPALLIAGSSKLNWLVPYLLGLPWALLAADLAFAADVRSKSVFCLVALAGLCWGALVSRLRPRSLAAMALAACLLLVWTARRPMRHADAAMPSLLLVVLDTTSAEHLSTYGYARPTSPHLTALARRGLLYERAIATAPWTLPSHASIFTGLYPSELGFDGEGFTWVAGIGSIAGDLEKAGRASYGISANPIIPSSDDLSAGFRSVWGSNRLTQPLVMNLLDRARHREEFQSRGRRVTELAIDWIDRIAPKGQPWFLFLNYLDPHAPYDPPSRERHEFAPSVNPGTVAGDTQRYNSGQLPLTQKVRAAMAELYDGEVAATDAALGQLLAALQARGYDESNLLIIVTADHGESLGTHGFVGHLLGMPDCVLKVPLLLVGPGIRPGRITEPVQLMQLRATIRAVLGLPPLPRIAPALPPWGSAPSLLIAQHPEPRWYLHELDQFNPGHTPPRPGNWVALERNGVKVVFDDRGHGETYDLHSDPTEEHPKPLRDGVALIRAYQTMLPAMLPATGAARGAKFTGETSAALRSLGYLN